MKRLKELAQWLVCLLVIAVLARVACMVLAPGNLAGIVALMLVIALLIALAGVEAALLILRLLGRK